MRGLAIVHINQWKRVKPVDRVTYPTDIIAVRIFVPRIGAWKQ